MMGCFFACFSTSKNKKRRHLVNKTTTSKNKRHEVNEALQATESTKKEHIEVPTDPITVSGVKLEDPSKKEATIDLVIKTQEEPPTENSSNNLIKQNEEKESERKEETPNLTPLVSDSVTSPLLSYPQNHRYRNCANIDDEYEDLDLESGSDFDGGNADIDSDNDKKLVIEESSESLFSLSIESRKQIFDVELGEKEVTSPMPKCNPPVEEFKVIELNRNARDRSQFVDLVLNPVENLSHLKAIKAKTIPPLKNQEKENINLEQDWCDAPISEELTFRVSTRNPKPSPNQKKVVDQEIAVDTSLSSWLVESESTPFSKASTNSVGNSPSKNAKSPRSYEDRPILGALTLEEIKQHSASTTPRRSRSRSPDETPIIGTVGSYWSHTGQTMNSDSRSPNKGMRKISNKNREDERVKWNSTPFKARLEMVMDRGTAEV